MSWLHSQEGVCWACMPLKWMSRQSKPSRQTPAPQRCVRSVHPMQAHFTLRQHSERGTASLSLGRRKHRHREVQWVPQGHTANRRWSWDHARVLCVSRAHRSAGLCLSTHPGLWVPGNDPSPHPPEGCMLPNFKTRSRAANHVAEERIYRGIRGVRPKARNRGTNIPDCFVQKKRRDKANN